MADLQISSDQRPSDVPAHQLTLFVVKASPTSTANSVKPLMLLEELAVPHSVYVVSNPGEQAWFSKEVNPLCMVPALEDFTDESRSIRTAVWESSSCLEHIADKYDVDHRFSGKDLAERTVIRNWTAHHTANLGASAKWWLWFKTLHASTIGTALDKLLDNICAQYDVLDQQLAKSDQQFIALKDRPTIVDFMNLPFANEKIAASANLDFGRWPHLLAWSRTMLDRPAVQAALRRVAKFGVEPAPE